jgi:hypothetical protein
MRLVDDGLRLCLLPWITASLLSIASGFVVVCDPIVRLNDGLWLQQSNPRLPQSLCSNHGSRRYRFDLRSLTESITGHQAYSSGLYSTSLNDASSDGDYAETELQRTIRLVWKERATLDTVNRLLHVYLDTADNVNTIPAGIQEVVQCLQVPNVTRSVRDDYSCSQAPITNNSTLPFVDSISSNPLPRIITYRLDIAYNGSCFCGWQRQASNALPAVQQVVEDTLQVFVNRSASSTYASAIPQNLVLLPKTDRHRNDAFRVDIRVAGRTDAVLARQRRSNGSSIILTQPLARLSTTTAMYRGDACKSHPYSTASFIPPFKQPVEHICT